MSATLESPAERGLVSRLHRVRDSKLVRQNMVLFLGGFTAGVGGFVYHAIAGRTLGPRQYGEVAALIGLYTVGSIANLTLVLILARYAADLDAAGRAGAIRHIVRRSSRLLALPTLVFFLLTVALAVPIAAFENFDSPVPVIWLGLAIAAYCYTAVPRGVLQGTQRFTALSANLTLELLTRVGSLVLLLAVGLAVTGSVIAMLAGVTLAYAIGMWSLRDLLRVERDEVQLRAMLSFGLTAAAGTLGIILLYNLDVVLAVHYLGKYDAGIYGSLNKIEVIIYYGTLSVSQVLFPRVVEAIATRRHPGRLLLLSGGLMTMLGLGAVVVFGLTRGLVASLLFGPQFASAQPYVLAVGFIGLGLSLCNLLVQFLMAVHDRVFIPILAIACGVLVALIGLFHASLAQIVTDVLVTIFGLLAVLAVRCLVLLPGLVSDDAEPEVAA
ncbi:MAG TPA: oligosaccharide flippase family protein [Candidatus Dormibacteraeota bacterium]|nr:oligosaccharide flippase family protein [Candidatus Dormibacteraeota bacterium]